MPGKPGFFFDMKIKNKLAHIIVLVTFALVLTVIAFAMFRYFRNQTPDKEIANAQLSMTEAKNKQANIFAPTKFIEAELKYQQAMKEWKVQNDKFMIWRDYNQVRILANESTQLFKKAMQIANTEKEEANSQMIVILENLKNKLISFEKNYRTLPLALSAFEQYSLAKLKYHEALILLDQKKIYEAEKLANDASEFIRKASYQGISQLEAFYKDYSIWQANIKWANDQSAKGKTVILISKIENSCKVIRSGKTIADFNAEFGQNWLGKKIKMGDKATPEGIYKVIKKKSGKETKFFKSLLIDYPNGEDQAKFAERIRKGEITKNSHIGNLIEIHGDGGKGVNWTDGCIALENKDMEQLYKLCSVKTPVVIIGAEKALKELLN